MNDIFADVARILEERGHVVEWSPIDTSSSWVPTRLIVDDASVQVLCRSSGGRYHFQVGLFPACDLVRGTSSKKTAISHLVSVLTETVLPAIRQEQTRAPLRPDLSPDLQ